MRGLTMWVVALALVAAGCGLKVEPTAQSGIVDGSLADTGAAGSATDAGTDSTGGSQGTGAAAAAAAGAAGTGQNGAASNAGAVAGQAAGKLFPNDIEGLTDTSIKICVHVPITGAAPVDRNPNRFGKFYFDWVNANGGIHKRMVDYIAYDDRYNPANAVQAAERCRSNGAFLIAGAAGTDQLVAVAKKARDLKFPYLMGPASVRDVEQFTPYAKMVGPDYEFQHDLLADFLVKKFPGEKIGMIRINSDFFAAAHDQFVRRLKSHGIELAVDEVVQKDENTFTRVMDRFKKANVKVINNFTTPTIWLKMLNQKPPDYNPTFTAVSPAAGFNLIAEALTGTPSDAFVFHHFAPAYPATGTDNDQNVVNQYPYAAEIRKFISVFNAHATAEAKSPRDDIDWQSYMSSKALHRLLEAAGPDITRTKLWTMLDSYKEAPESAAPGCPADFTRAPHRGAWYVNVLELGTRQWNNMHVCIDRPPAG